MKIRVHRSHKLELRGFQEEEILFRYDFKVNKKNMRTWYKWYSQQYSATTV